MLWVFFMMNVQSLRGWAGSSEVILGNTSCENSLDSKLSSALDCSLAAPWVPSWLLHQHHCFTWAGSSWSAALWMCNFWWAALIQYLNFTLKHLYSFCLFQKAVQIFLVHASLEREFLPTHTTWKAEGMLLLEATCVHKVVFLNSFFYYFLPVSCFTYLTCQPGKGQTDLHSPLLLVSAVQCIQVAKWRGIPDVLTDLCSCWHRTVAHVLKLKSGGFPCPVGGMAVPYPVPHSEVLGLSCATCSSRSPAAEGWDCVSCRTWALCGCCGVKAALPECKAPVPAAQLGRALNPEARLAFLWLSLAHHQWWLDFVPVLPALHVFALPWWCQNTGTVIPQGFLLFHHFWEANIRTACTCCSRGLVRVLDWNRFGKTSSLVW